jgi:hypothetical protein
MYPGIDIDIKGSSIIIPIELDTTIKISGPILSELIFLFDAPY